MPLTRANSEQILFTQTGTSAVSREVVSILQDHVSVKDFGAIGDGVADDTTAVQAALNSGAGVVYGVGGDTYLVSSGLIIPANTTFDLNRSTIFVAPSFPNTDAIVKIAASGVVLRNGTIDGNRTNVVATFSSGLTGIGVLVTDGGDGTVVDGITTKNCPTNGQAVISLAAAIDDVVFRNYSAYDNGFTGTGGEAQLHDSPLTNIHFIDGEAYDNLIGGDMRIQGIDGFYIRNHKGHAGVTGHAAIVVGVGEAANTCIGNISDSFFNNSNNAIASFSADGLVGGAGVHAGEIHRLEINLDNVSIKGAGGSNGILAQNCAVITGSNVLVENHTSNLRALTNSLVSISNLTLRDAVNNAAYVDAIVDIDGLTCEGWGASDDAIIFYAGGANSKIERAYLGYPMRETGTHDGTGNAASMTDSTAAFVADQYVGYYIRNTTDGSQGLITANTTTNVTATLAGGTDNDWDASDAYEITKEGGQDGIGVSSTPSGITLSIENFTGTRFRVAGVSGSILNTWSLNDLNSANTYNLIDGIAAPAAAVGSAKIYVDVSGGDLKIIFGDGTVKTIVVDT